MASSPAEERSTTLSQRAFALQEAIACWDQGYEALARGDLDGVSSLMDLAYESLAAVADSHDDTPAEAQLRNAARSARGRLEHGMRAGLDGLREELAKSRRGAKVLRGYADSTWGLGSNVTRDA